MNTNAIHIKDALTEFMQELTNPAPGANDDYWSRREREGNLTIDEQYVIGKHKIEDMNLPKAEHDKAIQELLDRLGY